MRSSEHAAHRLLMHSVHTSHLWLKVSPCVSFHIIHACALVCCLLSVSPHPSFYFLVLFLFQLHLMSNSAPDEFSIEDPLCNSSLGSMVTLDYVTPLTSSVFWQHLSLIVALCFLGQLVRYILGLVFALDVLAFAFAFAVVSPCLCSSDSLRAALASVDCRCTVVFA